MKNKKLMLLAFVTILIAGLVLLSGCSTGTAEPKETVTVTSEPNDTWSDYEVADEDAFIDFVNYNGNWVIASTSDSDILDLGWTICETLDRGIYAGDVVDTLVETAETTDDAEAYGTILAGAVVFLCPEYADAVSEYLQ